MLVELETLCRVALALCCFYLYESHNRNIPLHVAATALNALFGVTPDILKKFIFSNSSISLQLMLHFQKLLLEEEPEREDGRWRHHL